MTSKFDEIFLHFLYLLTSRAFTSKETGKETPIFESQMLHAVYRVFWLFCHSFNILNSDLAILWAELIFT